MEPSRPALFTIGYEGRTLDALVRLLREAGVERVVDVRISARSPRPGFSRGPLRRALEAAGLEYAHLPAAGNPFREEAARDLAAALARFGEHLAARPEIAAAVLAEARARRTALLCAEANPRRCHRSVLADHVAAIAPDLRLVHL